MVYTLCPFGPDAKGIISKGYSDDPVVSNFVSYGFSAFLPKPATKDEITQVINEELSMNQ